MNVSGPGATIADDKLNFRRSSIVACALVALCVAIGSLAIMLGAGELERATRATDLAAGQPGAVRLVAALAARTTDAGGAQRRVLGRQLRGAVDDLVASQHRLVDPHGELHLPGWPSSDVWAIETGRPFATVARTARLATLARRIAAADEARSAADADAVRGEAALLESADARLAAAYARARASLGNRVVLDEFFALAIVVFTLVVEAIIVLRPLRDRLIFQTAEMREKIGALDASERRLSLLLSQLPAIVLTTDGDDAITSVSGTGLETTSIRPGRLVGRQIDDVFAIEAERSRDGGGRTFRGTLEDQCFQVLVEPRPAGRGFEAGSICVALNVTESEAIARELERSRSTLSRAQTNAGAGVWEVDMRTGRVTWSPQMLNMLKWPPGRPFPNGDDLTQFVHPDDRKLLEKSMNVARELHRPFAVDVRLVRADGDVCWIQQHGEYLYDMCGLPLSFFGTAVDITQRKRAEEEIAYRAKHDALTELPNRALLHERINAVIKRCEREPANAAIVFIDLDHFKRVNDTFGHVVGDELLREVARRLVASVRSTDLVARNGGDEFVIVLEDVRDRSDVRCVVDKIAAALRDPFELGGTTLRAMASIGVRIFGSDVTSADVLIRDSDTAMYLAKAAGGNEAYFFNASMRAEADERERLEGDLRRAVDDEEFEVAYQPIVDATHGTITSFEALVRWNHPALGMIVPDRFISMIEASGLIVEVGRSVLRAACRKTRQIHEAGYPQLGISVNVSVRQLQHGGFVEIVRATLAETGLPARCLELELTESSLVHDVDEAIGIVAALQALGVRVAIDDFGTGYSSIAYLKHFRIDTVKIDRVFVGDLDEGRSDAAIVGAIASLAHRLGARVIAEGVETHEQAVLLHKLQCDAWQGFYYGKPIPSVDLDTPRVHQLMASKWNVDSPARLRVADRSA